MVRSIISCSHYYLPTWFLYIGEEVQSFLKKEERIVNDQSISLTSVFGKMLQSFIKCMITLLLSTVIEKLPLSDLSEFFEDASLSWLL